MSTGASLYGTSLTAKKKRRGGGGCCGCFFLVLLVLVGLFFAARKWAPNHLIQAEDWARTRVVEKAPVLDRWIPRPIRASSPAPTPAPSSTPSTATTPEPTATPEPRPTPGAFDILSEPPAFTELTVGTGGEAKLGQTVVVRYGGAQGVGLPETFMLGATEATAELESVVRGMKVGGKRKLGALEVELVKVL